MPVGVHAGVKPFQSLWKKIPRDYPLLYTCAKCVTLHGCYRPVGDASVGGFYNVEVVVGGGGGLVALVSGISPFLVRE